MTSERGQERKTRGLRETKDLAWEQGRGWEQVHSGHAGLDFSGTSREPIDIGARGLERSPRMAIMGAWDLPAHGDDPSAPGMGSRDLEKSLDGRLGRTGCSECRSEGTKKLGKSWRVYLLGLGTSNKTEGDLSRKLLMYSNRENVTAQGLAIALTSRHTPFGIFFISVPPKKPKTTKLVRIKHPWLSEQTLREISVSYAYETLSLSLQAGFNLIGERKTKLCH